MRISGNQTAIKEILNLLDPDFVPPFMCHCYGRPRSNSYAKELYPEDYSTHWCECPERDKWFEEIYGPAYEMYDVEYDGKYITQCKLIHKGGSNLLDGCVK